MKGLVNRRVKDYAKKRLASINDLDLIASWLLALSWSRRMSPSSITQRCIQFDCVACICVDGDLWVASNSQSITDSDIEQLRSEIGDEVTVYIVTNGLRGQMHAEMQLVSELKQVNKLGQAFYMGVSKPCCEQCRSVLDSCNIQYANWHNSLVKKWQSPF